MRNEQIDFNLEDWEQHPMTRKLRASLDKETSSLKDYLSERVDPVSEMEYSKVLGILQGIRVVKEMIETGEFSIDVKA